MTDADDTDDTQDPRLWKKNGWIAKIVKNEDGDGWAVEMTRVGDQEPVLVGPWTMGRDKVNPKPLDAYAFLTLVKTANEVMRRHEQAAIARLHRSITLVDDDGRRLRADLDIAQDDDDPHAILAVVEELSGEPVRSGRVSPAFKLGSKAVLAWLGGAEG